MPPGFGRSPAGPVRSARRMRGEERQYRLVEFAGPHLGKTMPAAWENLDFGARDQPCQLLREISRRHDIVLGADHQCRRLDPAELLGAVEGEDRIDPTSGRFGRRENREVLRLELAQALVV